MVDLIGWFASAFFVLSFLLPPRFLRRLQMTGAFVWGTYGVLIEAVPLVVSNILFILAAAYSVWRDAGRERLAEAGGS